MNFKTAFNVALAKKDTSVKDVSANMKCSESNLYAIVKANNPSLATVTKIAKALNMKASELIALGEE